VFAERFNVLPEQIGPLLLGAGVAGSELIVTEVVPAAEVQPFASVTVNV
jgi:hypothetical protein